MTARAGAPVKLPEIPVNAFRPAAGRCFKKICPFPAYAAGKGLFANGLMALRVAGIAAAALFVFTAVAAAGMVVVMVAALHVRVIDERAV